MVRSKVMKLAKLLSAFGTPSGKSMAWVESWVWLNTRVLERACSVGK
jgi:hypothetical protein